MSSINCFWIVKSLPPIETIALPNLFIYSILLCNKCVKCSGFDGAPIVAMAFTEGILSEAKSTAAPPNECPIKSEDTV